MSWRDRQRQREAVWQGPGSPHRAVGRQGRHTYATPLSPPRLSVPPLKAPPITRDLGDSRSSQVP